MAEYNGSAADIYYVDGENGNDGWTGDLANPWQTIQKAFDEIKLGSAPTDGDDIRIMKTSDDATYYGGMTDSLDVSWTSREVSIIGANSSGVVDGTVVEINGGNLNSSTPMLLLSGSGVDNVAFTNFFFNAGGTAQHCVEVTGDNNHNINWINCRFSDATSHGLYTTDLSNYWNFINCRFDNNGGNGCDHYGSQYGMTYKCLFDNNTGVGFRAGATSRISECVMYNNGSYGIELNGTGAIVCNCIIDSNGSDGIYVVGSSTSRFVDNVISNTSGTGIELASSSAESTHINTVFYKNTLNHDSSNRLILYNYTDTGTVSYSDASDLDFTPTSSSSVIDKGLPTHFKWFGTTGGDSGVGKFVQEGGESISIF